MIKIENKDQISNLIKKYERQLVRCRKRESDLEDRKENLSNHGCWSLGYFGGKTSLYEDIIDDLKDLVRLTSD